MKTFKRIFSILVSVILCVSMNLCVFAAEPAEETVTENSTKKVYEATFLFDDSGITPLSSVSGYGQKSLSAGNDYIFIDCDGSGYGGMGITIKTSCSSGDYSVQFAGDSYVGDASTISGTITTNSEIKFSNLWQNNLQEYFITFQTDAGTPSYLVQVWIYG